MISMPERPDLRSSPEMREHLVSELNAALRRPGMYGGELGIRLIIGHLLHLERGDTVWAEQQRSMMSRGVWTSLGVSGAFLGLIPAPHQDAAASVYSEFARTRGWLRPDRTLTDDEYERLRRELPAWAARDRSWRSAPALTATSGAASPSRPKARDSAPPPDPAAVTPGRATVKHGRAGLDTEPAVDQDEQGGAAFPGHPRGALLATPVPAPLDLDGLAAAHNARRLEVAEQPPAVQRPVHLGAAHVDPVTEVRFLIHTPRRQRRRPRYGVEPEDIRGLPGGPGARFDGFHDMVGFHDITCARSGHATRSP